MFKDLILTDPLFLPWEVFQRLNVTSCSLTHFSVRSLGLSCFPTFKEAVWKMCTNTQSSLNHLVVFLCLRSSSLHQRVECGSRKPGQVTRWMEFQITAWRPRIHRWKSSHPLLTRHRVEHSRPPNPKYHLKRIYTCTYTVYKPTISVDIRFITVHKTWTRVWQRAEGSWPSITVTFQNMKFVM